MAVKLGYVTGEEFDAWVKPADMVGKIIKACYAFSEAKRIIGKGNKTKMHSFYFYCLFCECPIGQNIKASSFVWTGLVLLLYLYIIIHHCTCFYRAMLFGRSGVI
jgi:hypothetical protein